MARYCSSKTSKHPKPDQNPVLLEALEVDATIESLLKKGGGTNKDNALYVHFDEPSASIDQQQVQIWAKYCGG